MGWRATITAAGLALAACSQPANEAKAPPAAPAAAGATAPPASAASLPQPDVHPAPLAIPPIPASVSPLAASIDQALWSAQPATPEGRRNALIRAEVLLARAHFSPGVIDGQDGDNLRNAIAAFEAARGLPVDGTMSEPVWAALATDTQPALTDYLITPDDVKGPFVAKIPTDYAQMAKLPALGFTSPVEALAEKFHMDEKLLKAL